MDKVVFTKKKAKRNFNFIGFSLIALTILAVMVPVALTALDKYASLNNPFSSLTMETSLLYMTIMSIVVGCILTILLLGLTNRLYYEKGNQKRSFKHLFGYCLCYFVVVSLLCFVAAAILQFFSNISFSLSPVIGLDYDSNRVFDVVYVLTYFLLIPILEEIIFRGLLYANISKYSYNAATWISAVAFALMHRNIIEIAISLIIGLYLAGVRKRTNSMISTIIIRVVYSAFIYLLIVVPNSLSIYTSIAVAVIYISMIIYIVLSKDLTKNIKLIDNDYKILDLYVSCPLNIIMVVLCVATYLVQLFI